MDKLLEYSCGGAKAKADIYSKTCDTHLSIYFETKPHFYSNEYFNARQRDLASWNTRTNRSECDV